jgi:hypothetical protein
MPAHTPHRAPRARTVAVALLAPLALACPAPGTTVGEMSRPRPDDAAPSPPETLSFEWTTADQARATDQRSHPFALFPDDRSEDDLARCREARIWEAPFDPQQVRCAYRPTASLRVGASTWWLGAYAEHSEWDGMTSLTEDVILAVPGDPTGVRHTVRQYEESIVDCRTTIVQRRQTVRDLDGDGRDELCIEEVRESGPGLFAFLALADRGEPWIPFVRPPAPPDRVDGRRRRRPAAPRRGARRELPRGGLRPLRPAGVDLFRRAARRPPRAAGRAAGRAVLRGGRRGGGVRRGLLRRSGITVATSPAHARR